jgi:hypothetical protein
MARKPKNEGRSRKGLVAWLIMLLTGSGAGAGFWQFRDEVVGVLRAFGVPIDTAARLPILQAIAENGDAILKRVDYRSPGRFEVTVQEVELPASAFPGGSTLDLELRVLRYDERGRETLVWDTGSLGRRSVVVASGAVVASWANYPFRLNWSPGDKIAFEVWNRRGLKPSKLYVLPLRDDSTFPFATGSLSLARWTRGGMGEPDPVASVAFEATRMTGEREDAPPRVARERRPASDDDDVIEIR